MRSKMANLHVTQNYRFSLFLFFLSINVSFQSDCFCENEKLCAMINRTVDNEVYIYLAENTPKSFETFDWSRISVVSSSKINDDLKALVCHAHSKNVKVNWFFGFDDLDLLNKTLQTKLIDNITSTIKAYHLDGINIDYEASLKPGSPQFHALTDWVRKITTAVKRMNEGLEVSFAHVGDATPGLRSYDVVGIADIIDYYVLMEYDFNYGRTTAGSNCGFDIFKRSLQTFANLNISFSKLITALPWYGYIVPCEVYDLQTGLCKHEAKELSSGGYSDIMKILQEDPSLGRQLNMTTLSPFAFFKKDNRIYRVDYDDFWSLKLKIDYALSLKVRGVGVFHGNCLSSDDSIEAQYDRAFIWKTLPQVHTIKS